MKLIQTLLDVTSYGLQCQIVEQIHLALCTELTDEAEASLKAILTAIREDGKFRQTPCQRDYPQID